MRFLVIFCLITCGLSSEEPPRIIIIGAGASGIAAASKLLQNGFNDTVILEAENRIGGRLNCTRIGEYVVDLGAEWVHGEENNAAFELAWRWGLLQRSTDVKEFTWGMRLFGSSGNEIPYDVAMSFVNYGEESLHSISAHDLHKLKTSSAGEFLTKKFNEYFNKHPELHADIHKPLIHFFDMTMMINEAGNSMDELSAKGLMDYEGSHGDQMINWKDRSYTTILDILMKIYPDPDEELPVKNITKLNTKVSEIKLNDNNIIKVTTADGDEYFADHVIVTTSLGVLQRNYLTLFSPPLPQKKLNAIKNLSLGHVAKIILYYDNPWWLDDPICCKGIYWTEKDRKKIENDAQKKWTLGISSAVRIEHRPKLMLLWLTGPHVAEMELIPEKMFQSQVKRVIKKFFGKSYNLTEPSTITRTMWNTNENFLGTYSYRGIQADVADAQIEDYKEPIMRNNKPALQFAGEGTTHQHSTVHGAIKSGWREANRLINYYSKKN